LLGGGFPGTQLLGDRAEAPELGRGRGGTGGEGASATSELGPAGGGRRGGPPL
jgi:hypothetical protein